MGEDRAAVGSEAPQSAGAPKVVTPRTASRPAIWTRGLTRDFRSLRAVDGLDLEVPQGSVFGFLGPNGAGKTTTIRLLLGLLPPSAGHARVLGYDVVRQAADVRRRCGALLEHHGLTERLDAADNLDLYGRIWRMPRPERRARTRELLEELGLWERRHEPVARWSRGMRQRLAIARTLVHRPSLLFLDEPTAGLDPVAAAELRSDLIRLARREDVTVFLNTHNLLEAERLCDRVAVIRGGRLLWVGAPAELRGRGGVCRVRVAGHGLSENVLDLLRGRREVSALTPEPGSVLVDLRARDRIADMVAFLVRIGVRVEEVARVEESLEDMFLSLVSGREGSDPRRKATGRSEAGVETKRGAASRPRRGAA